MEWSDGNIQCPDESGGKDVCLGASAVYRMSAVLFIMHTSIFIGCILRNDCSRQYNEGAWTFKFIMIFFLFFLFFFINNSVFEGYIEFAKVFSGIFMVFQSLIFIDLFYIWGTKWAKLYDKDTNCMGCLMIGTAVILFMGIIIFNIFNYILFNQCGLNVFITTLNVIIIVVMYIVQMCGYNPHGSLITTGAQGLYLTFLTFSAQLSGPDPECNDFFTDDEALGFEVAIGFLLVGVVMWYLISISQEDGPKNIQIGQNKHLTLAAPKECPSNYEDENNLSNDQKQVQQPKIIMIQQENTELKLYKQNNWLVFHFIMITLSIYSAMLLTNWGAPRVDSVSWRGQGPSQTAYWVKIIVSWIGAFLYLWTLIVPACFKNRDFNK